MKGEPPPDGEGVRQHHHTEDTTGHDNAFRWTASSCTLDHIALSYLYAPQVRLRAAIRHEA